jgi:hypothetical protein
MIGDGNMKLKPFLIMGALLPAVNANAATLVTPTLWAQKPIYFSCNLTNVSDKPRSVTTRIVNGNDGSEILKQTVKLAPKLTMNTTVEGLPAPGGPIYCVFTVEGSKGKFRGVAKLWGGPTAANSSDITAVSAE